MINSKQLMIYLVKSGPVYTVFVNLLNKLYFSSFKFFLRKTSTSESFFFFFAFFITLVDDTLRFRFGIFLGSLARNASEISCILLFL